MTKVILLARQGSRRTRAGKLNLRSIWADNGQSREHLGGTVRDVNNDVIVEPACRSDTFDAIYQHDERLATHTHIQAARARIA